MLSKLHSLAPSSEMTSKYGVVAVRLLLTCQMAFVAALACRIGTCIRPLITLVPGDDYKCRTAMCYQKMGNTVTQTHGISLTSGEESMGA